RTAVREFGAPASLVGVLARGLPLAELAVAALLFYGPTRTVGGAGALGLLVVFSAAIAVRLAHGNAPDPRRRCGAASTPRRVHRRRVSLRRPDLGVYAQSGDTLVESFDRAHPRTGDPAGRATDGPRPGAGPAIRASAGSWTFHRVPATSTTARQVNSTRP